MMKKHKLSLTSFRSWLKKEEKNDKIVNILSKIDDLEKSVFEREQLPKFDYKVAEGLTPLVYVEVLKKTLEMARYRMH